MTPAREEWRPVVGHEGLYEVSDQGCVRSLDRYVIRRGGFADGRPMFLRGRVLQPRPMPSGHTQVNLGKDGISRNHLVHHLVLIAFVGPRPDGLEGCHNDGNPANNRLSNLRWDTRSANCYDRVRHGNDHKRNRTHCPRNHLLASPNLVAVHARQGHRSCLACCRARAIGQRARRLQLPFDLKSESDVKYAEIMGRQAATGAIYDTADRSADQPDRMDAGSAA